MRSLQNVARRVREFILVGIENTLEHSAFTSGNVADQNRFPFRRFRLRQICLKPLLLHSQRRHFPK